MRRPAALCGTRRRTLVIAGLAATLPCVALDDLLAGGSPMSSAIARKVVQKFQVTPPSKNEDLNLTPREKQILEQLVKGSLYKEIAWELGIGFETVRSHIDNIYTKLHVRTRTEAVVKFLGPQ